MRKRNLLVRKLRLDSDEGERDYSMKILTLSLDGERISDFSISDFEKEIAATEYVSEPMTLHCREGEIILSAR